MRHDCITRAVAECNPRLVPWACMTVQIKAAAHVDDPADVNWPCWEPNDLSPGGRKLIVTLRDVTLCLSEPAARWLLGMLAAIMPPEPELHSPRGVAAGMAEGPREGHFMTIRIQLSVHVYHPGEVNRLRWDDNRELVVSLGTLHLVLATPAAKRLLEVLTAVLASGPSATSTEDGE
jgi:hypothetical protein